MHPTPESQGPAPLDRSRLEVLFGPDDETIELMIGLFVDSLPPWRTRLQAGLELAQLRELAHEVKGAASTVGAQPLADTAAALELWLMDALRGAAGAGQPDLAEESARLVQRHQAMLLLQMEELLAWAAGRSSGAAE